MRRTLIVLALVICAVTALRGRGQQMMGILGQQQSSTTQPGQCGNPGVNCLSNCSLSTVQAALTNANEGDTIVLPVCPSLTLNDPSGNTWTSWLLINKYVNLVGQGVNQTVLINNIAGRGLSTCSQGQPHALIDVDMSANLSDNSAMRLSGFTISVNVPAHNVGCPPNINVYGGSHAMRIDHVNLINLTTTDDGIIVNGDVWGVIDHVFIQGPTLNRVIFMQHENWQGVGAYADSSWAAPDTMGGVQQIYVENISMDSGTGSGAVWCEKGCRGTLRYSQVGGAGSHGTDSNARHRSIRHFEQYNNTYDCGGNPNSYKGYINTYRGGTAMLFNNNIIPGTKNCYSPESGNQFQVSAFRSADGFTPWGYCDGSGPWDNNEGTVWASGTADATSPALAIDNLVAFPNPNWTINQWAGNQYSIRNDTAAWGSSILSNNVSTVVSKAGAYAPHPWSGGDQFRIMRVIHCIDQPGMGAGALLSGTATTANCTTNSAGVNCAPLAATATCPSGSSNCGWVNESLDPLYAWSNTRNGVPTRGMSIGAGNTQPTLQENREAYNERLDGGFDGTNVAGVAPANTGGVGVGTFAAMPTTCTPLVGYWATDQQVLYQCSAPNTWTVHYQPYTYPHPLTQQATRDRLGRIIETGDGRVLVNRNAK